MTSFRDESRIFSCFTKESYCKPISNYIKSGSFYWKQFISNRNFKNLSQKFDFILHIPIVRDFISKKGRQLAMFKLYCALQIINKLHIQYVSIVVNQKVIPSIFFLQSVFSKRRSVDRFIFFKYRNQWGPLFEEKMKLHYSASSESAAMDFKRFIESLVSERNRNKDSRAVSSSFRG